MHHLPSPEAPPAQGPAQLSGEGSTGVAGQAKQPACCGTAARQGRPVALTKVSIEGLSCPSLPRLCVVEPAGLLLFAFIFVFINITKSRCFPWEMAVCIPLFAGIYRVPLSAASECLLFLTGFIPTFTSPLQGAGCRQTGPKMREQI